MGIALLAGGAQATLSGAVELARLLGWSERVIGLTIVAAGTGLPELVTSLVSSYRGRDDVAIANVIGSNLFNVSGILGIGALMAPLHVNPAIIRMDNLWMLGVSLLLLPMLYTGRRVTTLEGVVLTMVYASYLSVLLRGG
jgi:cation:H+ antiporter